jgi:hypothetical protein
MAAKKNSETTSTEPLRLMTVLESSAMAVLGGQWGAPASLLTFFSFPFLACLCSWGGGGGGRGKLVKTPNRYGQGGRETGTAAETAKPRN